MTSLVLGGVSVSLRRSLSRHQLCPSATPLHVLQPLCLRTCERSRAACFAMSAASGQVSAPLMQTMTAKVGSPERLTLLLRSSSAQRVSLQKRHAARLSSRKVVSSLLADLRCSRHHRRHREGQRQRRASREARGTRFGAGRGLTSSPPCSIDVVSAAFEGKSSVDRQRMVYKAIWQELQARHRYGRAAFCTSHMSQETVHAVDSMTTKTPQEAGK